MSSIAKSLLKEGSLIRAIKPFPGLRPDELCIVMRDGDKLFIMTDQGKVYLKDHYTFFGYLDGFVLVR
jgi:hypothetical protein